MYKSTQCIKKKINITYVTHSLFKDDEETSLFRDDACTTWGLQISLFFRHQATSGYRIRVTMYRTQTIVNQTDIKLGQLLLVAWYSVL